jgi:cytokinesis protein
MVESDERLRFNEEKAREEQGKKVLKQSRSGMIEERSPEWYLVKLMDKTITPKDASGLLVSLRGHELGCVDIIPVVLFGQTK